MKEEKTKKPTYISLDGLFWVGLFAMLIACMHYGYSCSACGCTLVDSEVGITE